MPDQQLTLFAAHWQQQFRRLPWVAPHDTTAGLRAGEPAPELGWVCPVCGVVEPSAPLLAITHGWDPHVPDDQPWHGYCWRSAGLLADLDACPCCHGWPHEPNDPDLCAGCADRCGADCCHPVQIGADDA